MGKMYYITNGLNYVQKIDGKYKTTNCSSLADIYNYVVATKIVRNSLPKHMKKGFYLKEVETSEMIDIHKYKSEASAIVDNKKISFDLDIVQQIKNEAESIMGLSAYTQEDLIKKREVLNQALSFYDLAMSDVEHIIGDNKPPAHIRTIIYGKQHEIQNIHKEIKQAIIYIDIMIMAHTESWTINKTQTKLRESKYVPYKGRTCIYDEIMQMIG